MARMARDEGRAVHGISRRGVLRGGLLAGAGVAAAGAMSGVLTGTAKAVGAGTRGYTVASGGAAILSYRAAPAVSQSGGGVSSFSVSKQSGTAAGDWIFIHLFGANSSSVASAGFTVVQDPNGYAAFLRRLADGTEGSSFSVTGLGGQSVSALIATVAGAASSLDATVVTPTSASNSTSLGVAGITVGTAGDWVLCFAGNEDGYSNVSYAITPPSGFTSKVTNGAQTANPTMMLADNESAAAGATGTKTCAGASASYWSGVMVALKP